MTEQEPNSKSAADNPWEDLVVSLLSVNQYSLERTYASIEGLREQGLTDPAKWTEWVHGDFVARLNAAGCGRGPFMTSLFALRLAHLGALVQSKGIDSCTQTISGRDTREIEDLLLPVNGMGPKVIANFYLLREIPRNESRDR